MFSCVLSDGARIVNCVDSSDESVEAHRRLVADSLHMVAQSEHFHRWFALAHRPLFWMAVILVVGVLWLARSWTKC